MPIRRKIKPDPNCKECGGEGFFIHDSYDHRGEHVQTEDPCECTIRGRRDDEDEYDDQERD